MAEKRTTDKKRGPPNGTPAYSLDLISLIRNAITAEQIRAVVQCAIEDERKAKIVRA